MSDTTTASAETGVRPFRIEVPEREIEELLRRIDATRWPTKELVADRSQGVQLDAIQELARFWTTDYDWRKCEVRLNALPQFKTKVDGLDIHFIHVESKHENALPLIMTHGWPGSIIELLETIGPLTDPTAHGGRAEDAFHLVLPSIPGYGFSDEPTELGWGPIRIGQAWEQLMQRLGYTRYVAQGGDVGSQVTDAMGRLGLAGLIGIHTNLLTPALGDPEALERVATNQRGTCCPRPARRVPRDRYGLLHRAGNAPRDDWLRAPRFTHRPRSLDDRSRYGRLLEDRPRLRRQSTRGQSHPRTHRRQPHALLAHTYRGLGGALVLGRRTRERACGRPASHVGFDSGRLHHVPRGDLADPAQLGRAARTPTSTSTSTRSTRAVTSPPGKNRSSSRTSCAPPSGHCANRHS